MSSEEIIDPTVQHNASVRRVLLHMVLPFVLIMMTVGAIVWVGINSYRTTSEGVSVLTRELMEATQQYIGQEVGDYIAPSAAGNLIAGGMIEHAPPLVSDKVFYSYGSVMLQKIPQLQSFYLADDLGNFTLITRSATKDVQDRVRLVTGADGKKFLQHTLYNAAGQVVGHYDAPANDYDPRTRPWYKNTANKDTIQWTQPYLFPSDKQFVMTSSLRFKRDDGHEMVFATNISLNELSAFLDKIKIGKNGSAMIVDANGRVIAGRNLMQHAQAAGWDPDKMVLDPKDYPVFALGYDHYRVRGFGPKHVEWDGKTYIAMASALPRYSQGWILLIVAPENDFGSFAHQSSRQSLQFAGIVTVFSLLLGGLYLRQLRRTEAGNRRLSVHQSQVAQESGALQQVAVTPHLFDPTAEPLVITEQLAQVTGARRASLWRFLHDGAAMVCDDTYDRTQNTHSGGFEMGRQELGKFFDAVEEGNSFFVSNAATDERTTRFERLVMREVSTHALAVYPVHGPHGTLGMLALEEPVMLPHLLYFVELMASIAGTRFVAQSTLEAQQTPVVAGGGLPAPNAPPGPTKSDNLLMRADEMAAVTGASIYPSVAVLVVSFSDPVVEGNKETATLIALINQLATQVQSVAQEEQLFAVEVAGHRMICMAGCTTEPDPTALFRLANAALKMRETFMGALAAADLEPVFTMGMDFGPAFGGAVGQAPTVFNLWGQTVSLAELMAESAIDPGTIQVTERVYASLRDRYLFRSRGSFFVPHLGLGRAYTLAARR
ncbi:adenylate/guanylate cyclase domain-containing protein [Acetobacter okinawensis]|uniref:Histidine kinase n=1 Tax=Acetobacter okinawensis TaxID=1076594 RepID=A0A252BWH3_9PROT|nr:cache domain-containing protein [Acetobacter okinawensis]OUJ13182.1 histidine kinase [Acetobacter okinawensis]